MNPQALYSVHRCPWWGRMYWNIYRQTSHHTASETPTDKTSHHTATETPTDKRHITLRLKHLQTNVTSHLVLPAPCPIARYIKHSPVKRTTFWIVHD